VTSKTPSPATRPKKFPVTWFLRLAVSGLLLVVIFRIVPIEQVCSEARRLSPALWLSALGLFLMGYFTRSLENRARRLMSRLHEQPELPSHRIVVRWRHPDHSPTAPVPQRSTAMGCAVAGRHRRRPHEIRRRADIVY